MADAPIELFVPGVQRDPYPTYARLRDEWPVYREPQLRTFLVSRWDDVTAVLRDTETFSSAKGVTPEQDEYEKPDTLPTEHEGIRRFPMLTDDPPKHKRLRSLVNKAFTMRRVRELVPWTTGLVERLLDEARPGESMDFVEVLAGPLPMTVIAKLLGVPDDEQEQFRDWSYALFVDSGDPEDAMNAMMGMAAAFGRLIAERRQTPQDDLITALVQATLDGESLDDQTLMGFCVMLITGGNETTTHLLSNFADMMADRPDVWARLRNERGLVASAIEECLRLESPSQVMWRTATRDVELHGVTIPEGSKVGVMFASANRDPRHFPEADTFQVDRDPEHVAFGFGIHYCLGAPLSRMEADVAVNVMLDRYARIERGDGPAERIRSSILRGFRTLPLRLVA